MATRKKQIVDSDYSKLDEYCIWLHEHNKSLRRAGFSKDDALWLIATKVSYPDWVSNPTLNDIRKHIDEDED
jgi:hypothetical protein